MKKMLLLHNSGFTVVEVLVASVIFMIGFSLLMALLNSTILKFSSKEVLTAGQVAQQAMLSTISTNDTVSTDSICINSGIRFRIIKQVTVENHLAKVYVSVSRDKQTKGIIQLYDEFVIPEK